MENLPGFYNVAVHPNQISIYYESTSRHRSNSGQYTFDENCGCVVRLGARDVTQRCHKNTLSKTAIRKITRSVNYLVYLVPKKSYYHPGTGKAGTYYLNFVTLVLPSQQIHTDNEIKSLVLQPFLNEMRKKWKVTNYLWRAEKQANGSIHFHLITDRFIWWNDLRNSWNYFVERLGYVTRYRYNQVLWHREGFHYRPELEAKWSRAKQFKAWQDGVRHDWCSPNSTDVHSLKTVASVRSYITKYITKSDQGSDIQGRLWGCSVDLQCLTGARSFAQGSIADELDLLCASKQCKVFKSNYYSVIYFDIKLLQQLHLSELLQLFDDYITVTFPCYRPPGLPFKVAA